MIPDYVLNYYDALMIHKRAVMIAGYALGGISPSRLHDHDASKFSQAEFLPYANRFYNEEAVSPDEFTKAVHHHILENDHHWQHWRAPNGDLIEMPIEAAREMVADWLGAGYSYSGSWDSSTWLSNNWSRIGLHEATRDYVGIVLGEAGYMMSRTGAWFWAKPANLDLPLGQPVVRMNHNASLVSAQYIDEMWKPTDEDLVI